jgi:hypothetical protein
MARDRDVGDLSETPEEVECKDQSAQDVRLSLVVRADENREVAGMDLVRLCYAAEVLDCDRVESQMPPQCGGLLGLR